MAIKGIKSVDFIITGTGEGVVNHNGAFKVYNPAAEQMVENHMYPKLRGLDPLQRVASNDGAKSMSMSLSDPAIAKAGLIISSETVRAALFRDASFGLVRVDRDNVVDVLASLHGLVRGYLMTETGGSFPRKSPLHVVDLECEKPGLTFNQGTNSKLRGTVHEKSSMYSYFKTDKDLVYQGKASMSIEDLQFIPLENSLSRSAYDHQISVQTGQVIARRVTEYLVDIAESGLAPEATFVKKALRVGGIAKVGDAGLLLNDDALRVLVREVRMLLESLSIRQGKGFMSVTHVVVDYNDTTRLFRCAGDASIANNSDQGEFARYYKEEPLSDGAFDKWQIELADAKKAFDKKKVAEKKAVTSKKEKLKMGSESAQGVDDLESPEGAESASDAPSAQATV